MSRSEHYSFGNYTLASRCQNHGAKQKPVRKTSPEFTLFDVWKLNVFFYFWIYISPSTPAELSAYKSARQKREKAKGETQQR